MISSNKLFEFNSPAPDDWRKKFQSELKTGNAHSEFWKIEEGLIFESYQSSINISLKQLEFNQKSQKNSEQCLNLSEYTFQTNIDINHTISKFKAKGIAGFWCEINDLKQIDLLSKEAFENNYILAKLKNEDTAILEKLLSLPHFKLGGIGNDPVADWMQYGTDYGNSFDTIAIHLQKTRSSKKFFPIMVDASIYHDAGAGIILESALTISAAVNYIDQLTEKGISPTDAFHSIFYSISVGPSYITEMAKLRALRIILKQVGLAYKIPFDEITPFIHVTNSQFYHSKIEENNNILRYTTAAMSAIIGGCNALTVVPHTINKTNQDAERLAQNCVNILQNEAYFGKVNDPVAGSYSIETLTENIRAAAWHLFLEIESKGGIMAYHQSGDLKNALEKSWIEKQKIFENKVMVGVNKYRTEPIPAEENKKSATGCYPKRNIVDQYLAMSQH